jgi:hypothetical protein
MTLKELYYAMHRAACQCHLHAFSTVACIKACIVACIAACIAAYIASCIAACIGN